MRIITTLGSGAVIAGLAAGPALASTHTVQSGDTLSGIAAQAGLSVGQVQAANPQLGNPDVITVGEIVNVPDGATGSSSAPAAQATGTSAGSSASTSTGVSSGSAPSSFQQCVAWRESSNTPTDPDGLYGILPSTWASLGYSGTAGQASVAQQDQAFQQLYAQYGPQPWSPYDGC